MCFRPVPQGKGIFCTWFSWAVRRVDSSYPSPAPPTTIEKVRFYTDVGVVLEALLSAGTTQQVWNRTPSLGSIEPCIRCDEQSSRRCQILYALSEPTPFFREWPSQVIGNAQPVQFFLLFLRAGLLFTLRLLSPPYIISLARTSCSSFLLRWKR